MEQYGCANRFNGGYLCEYTAKQRQATERHKRSDIIKFTRIISFIKQTPLTITRIKEEAFFL
ncbi:hypothetical protein A6E09_17360 [Aliivibrio fischeri]|nr:hypothetical protein A6E09_17360 [Aliivibrio fischeri]